MISVRKIVICAACAAAFALAIPDGADAARLGGGRSFGSAPVMSRPVAPSAGSYGKTFGSSSTMQRQAVPNANRTAGAGGAAAIPRSTGMFGGLFGGLAVDCQVGAAGERQLADARHALRDRDARKPRAVVERPIADARHAVRDRDVFAARDKFSGRSFYQAITF